MTIRYIVESITPQNNAQNVAPRDTVTIEFREHLDESSIENSMWIVAPGGKRLSASYNYSGRNKTVEIVPDNPFEEGVHTIHIGTLENGPKTVTGELSETPYNYFFRVGEVASEEPESPSEDEPLEESEEETPPTSPPQSDIFEPDIQGLQLLDSYPSNGVVVSGGEPVVLVFSEEVESSELYEQVFLGEKALHPLLAGLDGFDLIPLQVQTSGPRRTHTLLLPSQLEEGQEYNLFISPGIVSVNGSSLEEEINIPFQRNWDTMFTTVEDVKLVLGEFSNSLTDAELMRLIHRESVATYQIISRRPAFVAEEWENDTWPYAAGQYVVYKAAYQAILGQVIESSSGMRQSVKLGDFSVESSGITSRELSDLLGLLKEEVDRWWRFLNGIDEDLDDEIYVPNRRAVSAQKAGDTSPYEDFMERIPFGELGG